VNEALRRELLAMLRTDQQRRQELLAAGVLFHGYQPRMQEVHRANSARLREIVDEHGWPGRSLVGEDGDDAAVTLLLHAILDPELQRRCLSLLEEAADRGETRPAAPAFLLDKIRTLEGRPQVYGTQYDWDEHGELSPLPIEDPDRVDERRRAIGWPSLEDNTRRMRASIGAEDASHDLAARRAAHERCAREHGLR
jgi:hypothetical protein